MAIAFDAFSNPANITGTSQTFSHTCTGSNLVLFISMWSAYSTTSATYNGVSATQIGSSFDYGGGYLSLFYVINPATGANNVVVTQGTSGQINGMASSYTGAAQSSLIDGNTTNSADAASLTTSITTVADNCWGILIARNNGSGVTNAGTGTTKRGGTDGVYQLFDSNAPKTPAGSLSLVADRTGGGGATTNTIMATFKTFVAVTSIPDARVFFM